MVFRWLCLLVAIAFASPIMAASDAEIDGRWHGSLRLSDGTSVDVTIALGDADDGFFAEARAGEFTLPRRTFVATARPGIFEGRGDQGILGLLGISQRVGPEAGEPLVWARNADDGGLVIYRLTVASDGRFTLDRLALDRDGERLAVELSRRSERERRQHATGMLERAP